MSNPLPQPETRRSVGRVPRGRRDGSTGPARPLGWGGLLWIAWLAACAPLEVAPRALVVPEAPLSVEVAVQIALENHPDARIARARVEQAAADVDLAGSGYWPELSVGLGAVRTDRPSRVFGQLLDQGEFDGSIDFNDPGTRSDVRPEVAAGVTLYDGGRRRARLGRAEALFGAGVEFEREVRAGVAFETAAAWYRVHEARAAAAVARRERPVLVQRLGTLELERASGAALEVQVEQLRLRIARAEVEERSADADVRRAEVALARLLGFGVEQAVELGEASPPAPPPLEPLAALLERAREQRPELVRARRGIDAALAGLREAEAGYLPELSLSGAFGFNDAGLELANPSWLLGIGLVQSLTEAARTPRRVRRAASELLIAHEAARGSLLAVEGEVEAAWLDAAQAARALELTRAELALAAASLRRVEAESEAGAARAVDLAESQLVQERAAARERISALRLARARLALEHAVGAFPARAEPGDVDLEGRENPERSESPEDRENPEQRP